MCSRVAALALGASLGLASVAGGQNRADVERQVDALREAAGGARARLDAFDDSLRGSRRAMHLLVTAPFRLHTDPGLVDLATRAAAVARDELEWTGAALDLVARHEFVLRRERVRWGLAGESIESLVLARLDSTGIERVPIWGRVDEASVLATWLRQHALQVLALELDADFVRWLQMTPVFDTLTAASWTQLRLELVSHPATLAQRCYAEDLAACFLMLGLTPTRDTIHEWFDAKARRFMVESEFVPSYRRRLPVPVTDACLAGNDSACVRLLRSGEIAIPVHLPGQRSALLRYAIHMGGAGAMARLYAPAATPVERLERVAGAPIQQVVSGWLRRVRETRVPSDDLTAGISLISLAWIGLFGILALRSTRWR